MEIYCVSMTSILWYDLREYVGYCSCGCVYPLHCCFDRVLLYILTTCYAWPMTCPLIIVMIMHELKHEPKNLCLAQAVLPHPTTICTPTMWSEALPLQDGRYVNKLSNLLCITGCGFHAHLEKGGLVSPNMSTLCRVHELVTLAISNIAPVRTKTEKTT